MGIPAPPRPKINKRKPAPPEPPKPRKVGDNEKFDWNLILWILIGTAMITFIIIL